MAVLDARQKRAEELRRLTDKSASMSEEQLTELRADIKVPSRYQPLEVVVVLSYDLQLTSAACGFQHFVSERKYDEDIGKAVRFTFDLEPLKTSITGFGSGIAPPTLDFF